MAIEVGIHVHNERRCRSHFRLDRGLDEWLAELAARQHGVVGRKQLLNAAFGAGAIDLRVRRGRLHVVHRGVYAVGHSLVSREGWWMAAVLAAGDEAVLSHRDAAAAWCIRPSSRGRVDVTACRGRRGRPGLELHFARLRSDEVGVHEGIPITTVPRTLFDLAGLLPARQVERALHEAEVRRLWDPLSLPDLVARHPGARGVATLRAILSDQGRGATATKLDVEERFIAFLERAGLPRPETNRWLHVNGRSFEVDCVWLEARLVVELDGHHVHATRRSFERDRARDRVLLAAGWRVVRVTWRQLDDDPAGLAADLRALLRR